MRNIQQLRPVPNVPPLCSVPVVSIVGRVKEAIVMRDRRRYFARVFEAKKPSGQMVARESRWSEAVAVGSLSFVNTVKSELEFKAAHQPRCGGSTVQGFKSTK